MKNTLAMVQAVLNATVRSSSSVSEFTRAFSGRIASLAKTHALITEDIDQAVSFEGLLRAELGPYDERGRLKLSGPLVILPSELAVPFGMVLHEMTTNALRHGALGHPNGRIEVTWRLEEGPDAPVLEWTWNERGGPPVAIPTREGFGSRVLRKVLTLQAEAQVDVAYHPDGMRVSIRAPLRTSQH